MKKDELKKPTDKAERELAQAHTEIDQLLERAKAALEKKVEAARRVFGQ